MLGLADRGVVPGRDVAVIGFDNIPEGAMHRPALTTVAIGARAIGEEAARLSCVASSRRRGRPKASFCRPSSSFGRVAGRKVCSEFAASSRLEPNGRKKQWLCKQVHRL
jgi:LacI family transcriptional regulator